MVIDLSSVDVFADNEIDFDKRITFIFGKNGTGKSTITGEIKKLDADYEVSAFQGFSNIIDENKRLNAVVLGEENAAISRQIEAKKAEIEIKNSEAEAIKKTLQKPDDESESNFWTRKEEADAVVAELNTLGTEKTQRINEYNTEEAKITGTGGLGA